MVESMGGWMEVRGRRIDVQDTSLSGREREDWCFIYRQAERSTASVRPDGDVIPSFRVRLTGD